MKRGGKLKLTRNGDIITIWDDKDDNYVDTFNIIDGINEFSVSKLKKTGKDYADYWKKCTKFAIRTNINEDNNIGIIINDSSTPSSHYLPYDFNITNYEDIPNRSNVLKKYRQNRINLIGTNKKHMIKLSCKDYTNKLEIMEKLNIILDVKDSLRKGDEIIKTLDSYMKLKYLQNIQNNQNNQKKKELEEEERRKNFREKLKKKKQLRNDINIITGFNL
tara:strand:- start:239 stop:895 length:657 start_codon:yes stop_codon:yes gene_type:complete